MSDQTVEYLGLKCPQPVLRVAIEARKASPGTMLTIIADCASFPSDLKKWCEKTGKPLLSCNSVNGKHIAKIKL